mgnify:CR=1 FL=1
MSNPNTLTEECLKELSSSSSASPSRSKTCCWLLLEVKEDANGNCKDCGNKTKHHLRSLPEAPAPAAAGTPPQSEVWCVLVIALLSWSYACLWSCDTWVEQGRRREVVNLERDRGPWLRRLRNSPLTNSFL